MKRSLPVFASVLALLLAGSSAHADPVAPPTPTWGYNWSLVSQPNVNGTVVSGLSADYTMAGVPTGSITFTSAGYQMSDGTSNIVVANLSTNSVVSPASSESITNRPYYLRLDLYDLHDLGDPTNPNDPRHGHVTLFFSGALDGSFSRFNSNIHNTFYGAIDPNSGQVTTGPVTVRLSTWTIDYLYTVQITSFVAPGQPGSNLAGSIGAFVTQSQDGVVQIASTAPEPSTLLLSCLGLPFLGLSAWRQRRNVAQARA